MGSRAKSKGVRSTVLVTPQANSKDLTPGFFPTPEASGRDPGTDRSRVAQGGAKPSEARRCPPGWRLETPYNAQHKVVLGALRALMAEPEKKKKPIGFTDKEARRGYRNYDTNKRPRFSPSC